MQVSNKNNLATQLNQFKNWEIDLFMSSYLDQSKIDLKVFKNETRQKFNKLNNAFKQIPNKWLKVFSEYLLCQPK